MLTLKKGLGQHFLHDENMCKKIVSAIPQQSAKPFPLLEVGPGGGAISKYLYKESDYSYKAVELDREKVDYLNGLYPEMEIIHADFLSIDLPFDSPFYIIGNFPYNISSGILFQIVEWSKSVTGAVGMFQKEVAQRVGAKPRTKDYGILSVIVQAYYEVEYLFDVPAGCFTPPPNVVSGVIRLTNTNNPFNIANQEKFIRLVKTSFAQRRKMLRNTLKSLFPAEFLQDAFYQKRAEELSVKDFVELYEQLESFSKK